MPERKENGRNLRWACKVNKSSRWLKSVQFMVRLHIFPILSFLAKMLSLLLRVDNIFARNENIGKICKRTITWTDFSMYLKFQVALVSCNIERHSNLMLIMIQIKWLIFTTLQDKKEMIFKLCFSLARNTKNEWIILDNVWCLVNRNFVCTLIKDTYMHLI